MATASGSGLTYEEVGGINPKDGPVALCVGGVNRLTGQLGEGFWGACCDADEQEVGRLFDKAVLPTALLAKAHMPDLAKVVPAFNVESIEGHEVVTQRFSRKVEFESIDFNRRFWATVPKEYDPVALRELFSPGFLGWVTTMSGEIDFGINDRQLWFLWRLRERNEARAERGAEERRPAVQAPAGRDGRERHPHLPARALARGPGAVSGELARLGGVVGIAGHDHPVVLAVADDHRQDRLDRAVAMGGQRLVGGAERPVSACSWLIVGKARTISPASCACEGGGRLGTSAASVVSTPSGCGGVWAGARARKNQASKRVEIDLRRDPAREQDQLLVRRAARSPASSAARAPRRRGGLLALAVVASTAPPGKTQTLGMNLASALRFSSSTSSSRSACLPPRRSSTTEAAGRGSDGVAQVGRLGGPALLAPPSAHPRGRV